MTDVKIDSNESEGAFNEFIEDQLSDIIDQIINEGDLDTLGGKGSDIIIEMDDITPPVFVYDSGGGGGKGKGQGPGSDKDKLRFKLPFEKLMELIAEKLKLPRLTKEGKGKIKEFSLKFKTFGPIGVILDKKRTFKRALKTSVGMNIYKPEEGEYDIQIRRKDKRFKLPKRIEIPKYKAVVCYMGDISYSTYGERLELEKRLVNFIHNWIDYNYGAGNVEHRFFVHDVEGYEVRAEDFYNVSNAGGTYAAPVFDLIHKVAFNEYDVSSTNFYAFYFGDGEIFDDDVKAITQILTENISPIFNRVGIVEVKPSRFSKLNRSISDNFPPGSPIVFSKLEDKKQTIEVIKKIFGETHAKHKQQ